MPRDETHDASAPFLKQSRAPQFFELCAFTWGFEVEFVKGVCFHDYPFFEPVATPCFEYPGGFES
jgi:hypothetical protein